MLKRKVGIWLTAILGLMVLLFTACGPGNPTINTKTTTLKINTTSLPDGQVGIVYSQTLNASGGSGPYTWSVTEGSLPGGFTLLPKNGSINGNSNNPGTFNFTVQVNDGTNTADQKLSITIKPSLIPLLIGNTFFDAGEVGIKYTRQLSASGGTGKYTWSIPEGSLPEGLALDTESWSITGTPARDGTFYFTLAVTDSAGATRRSALSITIKPHITISTSSLPDGKVGTDYDQMLEYSGAVGNVTWSVSKGNLPGGLTLDSFYGEIYGKPEMTGTFNLTVTAKDNLGATANKDFSLIINPA